VNVLHQIELVEKNVLAYNVKTVQSTYKQSASLETIQRNLTVEKPSLKKNTVTARNLIASNDTVNAIALESAAHLLVNAKTAKTVRQ